MQHNQQQHNQQQHNQHNNMKHDILAGTFSPVLASPSNQSSGPQGGLEASYLDLDKDGEDDDGSGFQGVLEGLDTAGNDFDDQANDVGAQSSELIDGDVENLGEQLFGNDHPLEPIDVDVANLGGGSFGHDQPLESSVNMENLGVDMENLGVNMENLQSFGYDQPLEQPAVPNTTAFAAPSLQHVPFLDGNVGCILVKGRLGNPQESRLAMELRDAGDIIMAVEPRASNRHDSIGGVCLMRECKLIAGPDNWQFLNHYWFMKLKFCGHTEDLYREVSVASRLRGMVRTPNLVGVVEDGARLFALYDNVEGPDLHRFCSEGNPSVQDKIAIISTILRQVQTLHGLGFVKRNIDTSHFIMRSGVPVMVNFSRASHDLDPEPMCPSVFPFTAWESHNGGNVDGRRVDDYMLGILIASTLFPSSLLFPESGPGRFGKAYRHIAIESDEVFLRKHLQKMASVENGDTPVISTSLVDFLLRAVSHEPSHRLTVDQMLRHRFIQEP